MRTAKEKETVQERKNIRRQIERKRERCGRLNTVRPECATGFQNMLVCVCLPACVCVGVQYCDVAVNVVNDHT